MNWNATAFAVINAFALGTTVANGEVIPSVIFAGATVIGLGASVATSAR